ncbi:hypothetical protein IX51_06475 [uncultured archaeon]|nr:hypothetical protein IX51_06475 [uncultured archaeon]
MKDTFEKCYEDLESTEESAAECIHCMKKYGEQIFFDREAGRLKLGREVYDRKYSGIMETLSNVMGIDSLETYEKMDKKYNLTMY